MPTAGAGFENRVRQRRYLRQIWQVDQACQEDQREKEKPLGIYQRRGPGYARPAHAGKSANREAEGHGLCESLEQSADLSEPLRPDAEDRPECGRKGAKTASDAPHLFD